MWLMLILVLLPFLGFALYCYVISRIKRKFKLGDIVCRTNDDTQLIVIDYDRLNPSVVIVQSPISNNPYDIPLRRIDVKINEKYLIRKDPVTRADLINAYCKDNGITIAQGHLKKL